MIYCEALLVTILFFTLFITARSDLASGIIENRVILISSAMCLVTDAVYYSFFAQGYFPVFIINLIALSVVSVVLYAYDTWAAGDCKLMIAVVMAIPGRFYYISYRGVVPGFLLLTLVFSFAFAYVVCESVYLSIRNKGVKAAGNTRLNINTKAYIKSFLACTAAVFSINGLLTYFFPAFFSENSYLLLLIIFLSVLTVLKYPKLQSPAFIITAAAASAVLVSVGVIPVSLNTVQFWPYILMLAIVLLRFVSAKHNYAEIQVDQVRQGMILSLTTVMRFSNSKINGLPAVSTEDLRSRLSSEEAGSIKLWGASAAGNSTVVIVRKIPFAIFIAVGTITFIILELV